MIKMKLAATIVAAALAFSSTANAAFVAPPAVATSGGASTAGAFGLVGCVASIMLAAVDKGNKYKKQLTTAEAASCGLLYWISEANKRR